MTFQDQNKQRLIEKAKIFDRKQNIKPRKITYSNEEIELAGAWFEGEITTGAVADVMKCEKTNVVNKMSTALKQGIGAGRVKLVWYPPPRGDK